jgi:tetratricopeptide (TPR) repeat protein
MDNLLECTGGGFIFPDGTAVALENVDGMRRAVATLFGDRRDAAVQSFCDCAREVHEVGLPGLVPEYIACAREAGGSPEITARAILELGAALERADDLASAAIAYESAIDLPERDPFTWYFLYNNLGYCLAKTGRFVEAVPYCLAAIRINPAQYNAFKNLGIAYQGLGRFEEAAGCFRHAYIVNPRNGRARQHLADLLFGGRIDDVPDLLARRRVFEITESAFTEAQQNGGAFVNGTHVSINDFDGMYLSFAERFEVQTWSLCMALGFLCLFHVLEGVPIDLDRAMDRIATVGTPSEAACSLLQVAANLGDIGQPVIALEAFGRAKALIPGDAHFLLNQYHIQFGKFLLKGGRPREAETHYRESLRLDPWRDATHRGLGIVLLALGDIRGAEAAILTAAALSAWVECRIVGRVAGEVEADAPA